MKRTIRIIWLWIRFGKIKHRIVSYAGYMAAAEIECTGRFGKVIGYWVEGSYDPNLPYQGH